MKKVLIVSSHFPPLNTMAAKRYGYMSKYMKENGYEPYILTTRARGGGYLNAKLDLAVPIPEKNIYRIGDLGRMYPCLDETITCLMNQYRKAGVYSRIIEEESIGWFYKVREELRLEQVKDVDVVIGTFPSIGNIFVAQYISKMIGKPFVVEIRDLISDYNEDCNRDSFYQQKELEMEKMIIEDASGIITVTDGFHRILSERYPMKKVETIYNGWDSGRKLYHSEKKENYLYYAGSLYGHRVESLKLLINTIKKNELDIKVKIRSVGPQNFENNLRGYVADIHMQDMVEILPSANEETVEIEQARAKINLLISSLDSEDKALMSTLPGKLFELIRLDSPVIAIAAKEAEIGSILRKTNKGRIASTEEELLDCIKADLVEYKGYHKEIDSFSREKQSKNLCEFLNRIIEGEHKLNRLVTTGLSFLEETIAGNTVSEKELNIVVANKQQEKEKFRIMYQMMEKWLRTKQQGKRIESYFEAHGYKNIAIYGVGDIGKDLIEELEGSSITIDYAIDKSIVNAGEIEVVSPEATLKKVDAIVVTAIAYFDEISAILSNKMECPIVSLEDIIYELV